MVDRGELRVFARVGRHHVNGPANMVFDGVRRSSRPAEQGDVVMTVHEENL